MLLEKDSVGSVIEIHVVTSKIPKSFLEGKPGKDARGQIFFMCSIIFSKPFFMLSLSPWFIPIACCDQIPLQSVAFSKCKLQFFITDWFHILFGVCTL